MTEITMDTDWGAKGAQLTGAQVQEFIKNQLKRLDKKIDSLYNLCTLPFFGVEYVPKTSIQTTTGIVGDEYQIVFNTCPDAYGFIIKAKKNDQIEWQYSCAASSTGTDFALSAYGSPIGSLLTGVYGYAPFEGQLYRCGSDLYKYQSDSNGNKSFNKIGELNLD